MLAAMPRRHPLPKSPVSKPRSASFGPQDAIKVFSEQFSSVVQHEQLEQALSYVRGVTNEAGHAGEDCR